MLKKTGNCDISLFPGRVALVGEGFLDAGGALWITRLPQIATVEGGEFAAAISRDTAAVLVRSVKYDSFITAAQRVLRHGAAQRGDLPHKLAGEQCGVDRNLPGRSFVPGISDVSTG